MFLLRTILELTFVRGLEDSGPTTKDSSLWVFIPRTREALGGKKKVNSESPIGRNKDVCVSKIHF